MISVSSSHLVVFGGVGAHGSGIPVGGSCSGPATDSSGLLVFAFRHLLNLRLLISLRWPLV